MGYSLFGGFTFFFVAAGTVAVYIFFMIMAWRFIKAHESMATSMKEIAENLKNNKNSSLAPKISSINPEEQ